MFLRPHCYVCHRPKHLLIRLHLECEHVDFLSLYLSFKLFLINNDASCSHSTKHANEGQQRRARPRFVSSGQCIHFSRKRRGQSASGHACRQGNQQHIPCFIFPRPSLKMTCTKGPACKPWRAGSRFASQGDPWRVASLLQCFSQYLLAHVSTDKSKGLPAFECHHNVMGTSAKDVNNRRIQWKVNDEFHLEMTLDIANSFFFPDTKFLPPPLLSHLYSLPATTGTETAPGRNYLLERRRPTRSLSNSNYIATSEACLHSPSSCVLCVPPFGNQTNPSAHLRAEGRKVRAAESHGQRSSAGVFNEFPVLREACSGDATNR